MKGLARRGWWLLLLAPWLAVVVRMAGGPQDQSEPVEPLGAAQAQWQVLKWPDLVPPGWDPYAGHALRDAAALRDDDPRAAQWMESLQQAWSHAPTRPELAGRGVRLAGYVVPLDLGWGGLREFLLVPYAGACIHQPPPPSNQIVHVRASQSVKGLRDMDVVWVGGTLGLGQIDTDLGSASYTLAATHVAPYQWEETR